MKPKLLIANLLAAVLIAKSAHVLQAMPVDKGRDQSSSYPEDSKKIVPSFDCAKARPQSVEEAICVDPALARADQEMAMLYHAALQNYSELRAEGLRSEQKDWLRTRESQCSGVTSKVECLRPLFKQRIQELRSGSQLVSDLEHGFSFYCPLGLKKQINFGAVPKNKVSVSGKAVGGGTVVYSPKTNQWLAHDEQTDVQVPVCYDTSKIGLEDIPAYGKAGNIMIDECEHGMTILTNQSYAIWLGSSCNGEQSEALIMAVHTFRFKSPVKAITAECPSDPPGGRHIYGWSL